MPELKALQGKYNILLFRLLKDATQKKGAKIALQTDHTFNSSVSSNAVQTKDGPIIAPGSPEKTYDFNFIAAEGDTLRTELKKAHDNNELVECWNPQIDPSKLGGKNSKHPGSYCQGYITSYSESSPSDGNVTISMTLQVEMLPKDGQITLDAEQSAALQYEFRDTEVVSEG